MKNVNTHCDTGICNDPACGSTCVMDSRRNVVRYPIEQAAWDLIMFGVFGFIFGFIVYVLLA